MALRNHLIHIDDLINLQNSRLRGLNEEFENDVKMIKSEYDREREDIERNHYMETRELREMILTIEEEETRSSRRCKIFMMAFAKKPKTRTLKSLSQ